jgi:hypothetical protein
MKKALLLGLAIMTTLSFVGCATRYNSTTGYPYNNNYYNDGYGTGYNNGTTGDYYNNSSMYR